MTILALLAQTDPRTLAAIERIATAQVVMAVVMSLIGLMIVATAVMALLQLRAVGRTVNELKPRLAPLIDRATHVANDAAGATDNVRRKVDDVLHTVEELRRSLERAHATAEERVARFNAVLDVVQTEAEDLMLDAAATARGMHETARVLREPQGGRRIRQTTGDAATPPGDDEEDEHE
jgi:methyl-accepting chemotaxis protein